MSGDVSDTDVDVESPSSLRGDNLDVSHAKIDDNGLQQLVGQSSHSIDVQRRSDRKSRPPDRLTYFAT